jgi:hypothetical protein
MGGVVADDQGQVARLLDSIEGKGPAEFFKLWVQNDATEWVARIIRFGANIGLGPKVSTPILFEVLNELRARIEREGAEARPREDH